MLEFKSATEMSHFAETYTNHLRTQLEYYDLDVPQVSFITCDNFSSNKKIAELLDVPMIGCASHKYVKHMLKTHEPLLERIHVLMKKL